MIDLEKILRENYFDDTDELNFVKCKLAMKQAIRESIPIILKHCADNATILVVQQQNESPDEIRVSKDSITNQKGELIKLLGV